MKHKIILTACIILMLAACKKDRIKTDQPMLQDGPMSAQLGKLIYLGEDRFSRSTPFWGRNSDELFITTSTEILRVDIAAKEVKVIDASVGLVTGKTYENSGVIFLGKRNDQHGYYVFNFSTNSIEKIIQVPHNQGTNIYIAGNNIFYSQSPAVLPSPPCSGYCWPMPGPYVPVTFYHLDKRTQQITELKDKQFMIFSTDGSQAILSSQLESRMYVYDSNSRTINDSSDVNSNYAPVFGLFFYGGVLHSFEVDVLSNITIKVFNTGQILRQYQSNNIGLDRFRISTDGTKLYFSGGIFNGNSRKILLYNIATNTEKTIADLPSLQGGGLPFGSFVLSDDNKKMVTEVGNDIYVKVID